MKKTDVIIRRMKSDTSMIELLVIGIEKTLQENNILQKKFDDKINALKTTNEN